MGDTGSLTIGGVIAVLAIAVSKELLIPLLCGIFLVENFSVVLQVGYFKYQKTHRRRQTDFPDVAVAPSLSERKAITKARS
jgi:UDP-N-acetylmuramyl pentapeptide phosphotransferase/UDP-N-acetylglucosamine-1-phosphate transferase